MPAIFYHFNNNHIKYGVCARDTSRELIRSHGKNNHK